MGASLIAGLLIGSIALAAGSPPSAAPGKNPLTCFAVGPDGACTSNGKTATIDTTGGLYAGVYLPGFNTSFYGVRTALVTKLSNTFTGPLGIDPHWSIPIDDRTDSTAPDGFTDYFVFTTFADCNNGAGLVDVINDATCTIYKGNTAYVNWAAFVTANPNTYIALSDNYAFIIADGSGAPGVWTISNVAVGKPGK